MKTILIIITLISTICAQFSPNPAYDNLADNTVMDLGAFECAAQSGTYANECRKITDYSGFVYDADRHQMVMFGGGHATTMTDAIEVFNCNTLVWSPLYDPTPCGSMVPSNLDRDRAAWVSGASGPFPRPVSRHTYDLLLAPPGLNEFLILAVCNGGQQNCPSGFDWTSGDPFFITGRIAHYSFQSNTWLFASAASGSSWPVNANGYPSAEYDPVSGKVIFLGRYGLFTYDVATQTKERHIRGDWGELVDSAGNKLSDGELGGWCHLVYFPPNERFYYFDRHYNPLRVYELQLDRTDFSKSTVTRLATTGTPPPSHEHGYDYDAANQIIGGGVTNSRFYAFDPVAKTWDEKTIQGGSPGNMAFHALGYDPVNNVFIFLDDDAFGKHTWAYRYKKGTTNVQHRTPCVNEPVLRITPNPFSKITKLSIRVTEPGMGKGASLYIYSPSGKLVKYHKPASFNAEYSILWDAGTWPAGVYLVRLEMMNKRFTKRLVCLK